MKIYRRWGYEKYRLVFIAYVFEDLFRNTGCFGIAPHKWEDHHLVLRHRRSSVFLPPLFSFQLVILMEEHGVYLVFVLNEA